MRKRIVVPLQVRNPAAVTRSARGQKRNVARAPRDRLTVTRKRRNDLGKQHTPNTCVSADPLRVARLQVSSMQALKMDKVLKFYFLSFVRMHDELLVLISLGADTPPEVKAAGRAAFRCSIYAIKSAREQLAAQPTHVHCK